MCDYKKGDVVVCKVTGIESYGIFVSFGDNCNGLIHISEISPYYVRDVSDYANIGDTIKARILDKDDKHKYKLSIKENTSKKNRNKIIETPTGFKTLNYKLNQWIDEYISNNK